MYNNGRLSPFTKLVILTENPKNTFYICYCYSEQYNGPHKSLNSIQTISSLTGKHEFDYLGWNWLNLVNC